MRTTKFFIATLVWSFVFISCGKKDDLERDTIAPTISNVLINGATEITTANASDTLRLSATFSDDRELGKVDIIVEGEALTNWSERKYVDLHGSTQSVNQSLMVLPNAKEGSYEVRFEFTDAGGNKSSYSIKPFTVLNESIPEIVDLDAKFDNGQFDHQVGDTLRLSGYATDDKDIQVVAIRMTIPPGYSGNQVFYEEQIKVENLNDAIWDFEKDGNVKIYFPKYAKTGVYTLSISILDNEGNIFTMSAPVSI